MIFVKVFALQFFWFTIVSYGKLIDPIWQILAAVVFVALDFVITWPKISLGRYVSLILFFLFLGFLNDSLLISMKFITKESYHYGNLSLWIVFIAYFENIFLKFKNISIGITSCIGALAGAFSYWSASRLGAIAIVPGKEIFFVSSQLIFWAIFFPISLKLYFKDNYWDNFLDKTI